MSNRTLDQLIEEMKEHGYNLYEQDRRENVFYFENTETQVHIPALFGINGIGNFIDNYFDENKTAAEKVVFLVELELEEAKWDIQKESFEDLENFYGNPLDYIEDVGEKYFDKIHMLEALKNTESLSEDDYKHIRRYYEHDYSDHGMLEEMNQYISCHTLDEKIQSYAFNCERWCKEHDAIAARLNRAEEIKDDPNFYHADSVDASIKEYEGEIVIVKPERFNDEVVKEWQVWLCTGGFGARANSMGTKCYVKNVYDGEETHYTRSDILGVIKPELMDERMKEVYNEYHGNTLDLTQGQGGRK